LGSLAYGSLRAIWRAVYDAQFFNAIAKALANTRPGHDAALLHRASVQVKFEGIVVPVEILLSHDCNLFAGRINFPTRRNPNPIIKLYQARLDQELRGRLQSGPKRRTVWSGIDWIQIMVVSNLTQQVAVVAHKYWSPSVLTLSRATSAHPGAHRHI
jgi:hypothetical protein